ncbi:hypothetical protein IH980_03580 [Patescibacteria group bacterium]|nr:hypothetical protein [Patescibacteria group bacterium]
MKFYSLSHLRDAHQTTPWVKIGSKRTMISAAFVGIVLVGLLSYPKISAKQERVAWWEIQSIDTMKYSRDVAREKLRDASFGQTINTQVKNIANAGATHVAIGTPYDEEFFPFLTRWVKAARKYGLNVWFRGNWAGWQEWFEYPRISREQHIEKTRQFILANRDLFEDGDIFTPCPECENGGPGDPRRNRDVIGHRSFLRDESQATKEAFEQIGKDVATNYYSMNGDVARLVMDRETTAALGGVVVIDHYVPSPDQLADDVKEIASRSGGKVILGEFGVPIPDIHGNLSEAEQAEWLAEALGKLSLTPELVGVNYWVNVGGSTQLWDSAGKPRLAAAEIAKYFTPTVLKGTLVNEIGKPITNAIILSNTKVVSTDVLGKFELPVVPSSTTAAVLAQGYKDQQVTISPEEKSMTVVLVKTHESLWFKIAKFIYNLYPRFSFTL